MNAAKIITVPTRLRRSLLISTTAVLFSIGGAVASPANLTVFGHAIEINKPEHEYQEQLSVDKKQLLKSEYITLVEVGSLGGTGYAIGETSPGGNSCNGSLFVLSFVANEPTRIDGPLNTCGPVEYKVDKDRVVVEVKPTPSVNGARWTWTESGFSPPETLKFAPVSGKGWNALRSRTIQHPSELSQYSEFDNQLAKMLGTARYSSLKGIFTGPGSVEYTGNIMIGSGCQAHSCDNTSVLIAIDISSQRFAIALNDGTTPVYVVPKEADWPDAAKPDLHRWLLKWRKP